MRTVVAGSYTSALSRPRRRRGRGKELSYMWRPRWLCLGRRSTDQESECQS